MTVRRADDAIWLEGACGSDDAATLHEVLMPDPRSIVDWSRCDAIHAAVLQVLLAVRPPMRGAPAGSFLRLHVAPLLMAGDRGSPLREADR